MNQDDSPRVSTGESRERLVRIETKLDAYLSQAKDQEDRIRVLEAWRSYTLGVAAILSLVSGKLASMLLGHS